MTIKMKTSIILFLILFSIHAFCQEKPSFSGTFKKKKAMELIVKNAKSLIESDLDSASYHYNYTLLKTIVFAPKNKTLNLVTFSGLPNYCGAGVWGYAIFEKKGNQWTLLSLDNEVSQSEKMGVIPTVKMRIKNTEIKFIEKGKLLKLIKIGN